MFTAQGHYATGMDLVECGVRIRHACSMLHFRDDLLNVCVYSGVGGSDRKKKSYLQYGRPSFDPWVGKIPWRSERLSTPVFMPGEFHGQRSLEG